VNDLLEVARNLHVPQCDGGGYIRWGGNDAVFNPLGGVGRVERDNNRQSCTRERTRVSE